MVGFGTDEPSGASWLKISLAVATALGTLLGGVVGLVAVLRDDGGGGSNLNAGVSPTLATASTTEPQRDFALTGRYRQATNSERSVRVQAPAKWVWRSAKFEGVTVGVGIGPAVLAYPHGNDPKKKWDHPQLYVGASRSFAEQLQLASGDRARASRTLLAFLNTSYDWKKDDCELQVSRPFSDHGYLGVERRWTMCGPERTGRLWEVFAYPVDRSLVVQFHFFQPVRDSALEDVGQTALATFAAVPERIGNED